ncbi:MAG: prolyl oligopeptidase family serine peptidase [Flavobacterium sp.]|nr:prolyl oligopeptidase family serine peptidase [Pedobacter sp.]
MRLFLASLLLLFFFNAAAQDLKIIKSNYLKTSDSLLLFKPSNYSKTNNYPLLYLLHGHSANYKSWSKLTDLQKLADQYQFLIVCPDGLKKSWYINSPLRDSSQYESFFFKELVPFIHEKYSINKNEIFITGASMGGYGSLWLFMQHNTYFRSAGSTSGVVNLRHSGFKASTVAEHLGAYAEDNKNFDSYSIVNNVKLLVKADKPIIFDIGTEDYLYKCNKALRDSCDFYKVKVTYTAQPGKHTGGYWSKTILQHLRFFSELIADDNQNSLFKK